MKFQTRVFLVVMSLVVILESATFFAVLNTTRADFIEQGNRELALGALVFDNAIDSRSRELAVGVAVLASDFGFKRAAAVGDEATIRSALINHGQRIGADLTMLVDTAGTVRATSKILDSLPTGSQFPLEMGTPGRGESGTLRSVLSIDGLPLQIVLAPVRAPDLIGWVAVGFAVDDVLAQQINNLTHLDVTIADLANTNKPVFASTLSLASRNEVAAGLDGFAADAAPVEIAVENTTLLSYRHSLGTAEGSTLDVILSLDMEKILHGYDLLRLKLLGIMLATLVLSAFGAKLLTRAVSRPLQRLARATRRISRGDYRQTVDVESEDELGTLAAAFNEMQRGIQNREEQIVYQSKHDVLTGLPNRNLMADRLDHSISRSMRNGSSFSVLMLDIDAFKDINDTLGHATGDQVLQEVAGRLRRQGRDCDTVARFGGDEFVILLDDTDYVGAMRSASRLADAISETVTVQSMQIRVRASIGIASFPQHAATSEEVLRRADIAMYNAKNEEEHIAVYTVGQDEDHLRRIEMVNDLRDALDKDLLHLEYQPKMDLRSGQITAVEALVRWPHPEHGFISPEEFVPLAERSGYIRRLTHLVLVKALLQLQKWRNEGLNIQMSVNLSALDLLDQQLPDIVAGLLSRYSLEGSTLTLEITESAVMNDTANARDVMKRLREQGIKLSIDDFGTGHSSLAQLKSLPVDELKIDKSFVLELDRSNDDATIVRSTIELGHNMGLSVTAEGVETDLSRSMLMEFKCDVIQGYLLSRPLPVEELEKWLRQQSGISGSGKTDGKAKTSDSLQDGEDLGAAYSTS